MYNLYFSAPEDACSYLSENYRSRCTQVYNYHRLLSWDSTRGLHVDIFKVPTCCSCQIDGYRDTFPPLADYDNKYSPIDLDEGQLQSASNPYAAYSTIRDIEDEEDDVEEDDDYYRYQFGGGNRQKKKPGKLSVLSKERKITIIIACGFLKKH